MDLNKEVISELEKIKDDKNYDFISKLERTIPSSDSTLNKAIKILYKHLTQQRIKGKKGIFLSQQKTKSQRELKTLVDDITESYVIEINIIFDNAIKNLSDEKDEIENTYAKLQKELINNLTTRIEAGSCALGDLILEEKIQGDQKYQKKTQDLIKKRESLKKILGNQDK